MSAASVFLLQAALIVGVVPAIWYWTALRRVLPLAVFQILVGIALGPSLLGPWSAVLFPPGGMAALAAIANLGVVVFAFVLGLHLDLSLFRPDRGRSFALVSLGSIAVPVACGVAAGAWIGHAFPDAIGPRASPAQFAAGMGICIGVTALPVLAAILADMGLLPTRVGQQALGYAAVNDLALWCLLAMLLAVGVGAHEAGATLWRLALGGTAYVFVAARLVRPWLSRLARAKGRPELHLALVCLTLFVSAAATDALGLHAILGGLVAGLVVPREWRTAVLAPVEVMTAAVLLPFFFTLTGLRTTIGVEATAFTGIFAIATLTAIAGKIGGTAFAARLSGETWSDALALGALMQSKGLMEVVALTVLLEAGIITTTAFSAMVVMALVTTILAAPLARLAWRLPAVRVTPGMRVADARRAAGPAARVLVDPSAAPLKAAEPRPDVSVVVVSWNDWPMLRPCLASVLASLRDAGGRPAEARLDVIVIDNASSDGTADQVEAEFPAVRLVRNEANLGHARAVNQGFRLARGRHLLLLDSDTVIEPDCISRLLAHALDHPEAALLAPRTFNPDGTVQETARNFPGVMSALFGRRSLLSRVFPNNRYLRAYLCRDHLGDGSPFAVQQISGSCMFFPSRLLDEAGPWDEEYFGYWVDTDWCYRLHHLGHKIVCVPAARIVHHESNARGKRKDARRVWIFHYGAWRLYTRWYTLGRWDPLSIAAGVALLGLAGAKIAAGALLVGVDGLRPSLAAQRSRPSANESR